jgi:hypothetical protein
VLTGVANPSSAIAELVERAATGARPAIAVSVPSDAPNASIQRGGGDVGTAAGHA